MAASRSLFDSDLPPGFHYRGNFITAADERILIDALAEIEFQDFEMRGAVARRRVAFFGQSYDRAAARPLPSFLLPLRAKISRLYGVHREPGGISLLHEDRPGTPIGIAMHLNTTSSPGSRSYRRVG